MLQVEKSICNLVCNTAQKMKNLVTFTEEIISGKLHFMFSVTIVKLFLDMK